MKKNRIIIWFLWIGLIHACCSAQLKTPIDLVCDRSSSAFKKYKRKRKRNELEIETNVANNAETPFIDYEAEKTKESTVSRANPISLPRKVFIRNSLDQLDDDGVEKLNRAVFNGRYGKVEWLILNGATIDVLSKDELNTPLHYAVKNDNTLIAERLLEKKANPNAQNVFGNTPLHLAAVNGLDEMVALLLEHGADQNSKNSYGEVPLELLQRIKFEKTSLLNGGTNLNTEEIIALSGQIATLEKTEQLMLSRLEPFDEDDFKEDDDNDN